MEEDWYTEDIYHETILGSKRCLAEDFGTEKASQDYWHTWITDDYAFDLFCPDLKDNNLTIYNQKGAMISKSFMFKITRCQEQPGAEEKFCKDEAEVEKFIDEMTVQLWVIEGAIDMRHLHGNSFARNQRLLGENKIRVKDEIPNQILFIGQKTYHSYERLLGEKEDSLKYDYYEVDSILKTPIIRNSKNTQLLLREQFYLSPKKVEVRRVLYGLFNVVTEMGCLIKFAQVVCRVMVVPISEFTFFLVLIKRLYFLKTDNDDLIDGPHEGHAHEHKGNNPK